MRRVAIAGVIAIHPPVSHSGRTISRAGPGAGSSGDFWQKSQRWHREQREYYGYSRFSHNMDDISAAWQSRLIVLSQRTDLY